MKTRRAVFAQKIAAESEAKRNMEIALKALSSARQGRDISEVIDTLREFDIPDDIIEAAIMQTESALR